MLKQITEWNTVKKIWMTGGEDLFSQQSKPFSGRWPTSGMMQNGVVYELQMQEHPITDLGSSSLPIEMLPTPTTQDAKNNGGPSQFDRNSLPLNTQVLTTDWGKYEPAIKRWEQITNMPAPAPTKPDGKDGNHRLSAEFTEWMMGLPAGWITDPEIGLTRNEQLKACGNGVVPQQAELALRTLLTGINLEGK